MWKRKVIKRHPPTATIRRDICPLRTIYAFRKNIKWYKKAYINGCSTVMLKVDRVGFGLDHCPQKFTMGGGVWNFFAKFIRFESRGFPYGANNIPHPFWSQRMLLTKMLLTNGNSGCYFWEVEVGGKQRKFGNCTKMRLESDTSALRLKTF